MLFLQEKPIKAKILGIVLIVFSFFTLDILSQFISLILLGSLILGYSVNYKITKDFKNKKIISLFGLPIIKTNLNIQYPEYISIFGASFSQENQWGPVAALGTSSKSDKIVIRLFKDHDRFTLLKSNNYEVAKEKATKLSEMLEVNLVDNVNE